MGIFFLLTANEAVVCLLVLRVVYSRTVFLCFFPSFYDGANVNFDLGCVFSVFFLNIRRGVLLEL